MAKLLIGGDHRLLTSREVFAMGRVRYTNEEDGRYCQKRAFIDL